MDQEGKLLLKEYFYKTSNKINEICSKNCKINYFEDLMLQNISIEDFKLMGNLDYNNSFECYENCVSKYFSSSMIGVNSFEKKFFKGEIF
jgi:hypothetical protein